jgi:hypothetical protein
MKKIKENENGKFEWIDTGNGNGYWSQIEDHEMIKDRVPIACPACKGGLDLFSVSYYNRHGVCADCTINFIEDRQTLPQFKNRDAKVAYVKQKIAEKKSIL